MKIKHPFAFTAPLVFVFLAACDFGGLVEVKLMVDCPLPIPVVTDTLLTGTFNGVCPYYIFDNDTLKLIMPGVTD